MRKVIKGDWYMKFILTLIAIILLGLFQRAGKIQRIIERGERTIEGEVDVCITAVGNPLIPMRVEFDKRRVRGSVPVEIVK